MPVPFPYPTVPGRLLGVDKAGKCLLGVYRARSYLGKKKRITLRISPQFQEVSFIPPLNVMSRRFLGSLDNVAKVCLVVSTGKGVDNH